MANASTLPDGVEFRIVNEKNGMLDPALWRFNGICNKTGWRVMEYLHADAANWAPTEYRMKSDGTVMYHHSKTVGWRKFGNWKLFIEDSPTVAADSEPQPWDWSYWE